MKDASVPCPCCSGLEYRQCCRPLHAGELPENALQLMRARYSAYALNIPAYIIATTHPASPQYMSNKFNWQRSLSRFSEKFSFEKLEILDFQEKEKVATVTFTAHLLQQSRDATFTERSHFEKMQGQWLYRGGQLAQGHAPHLITTGQLRLLPLAYYGDPILRRQADPIEEITEDIRKLVEEMVETMDACDGIGLAAPQVHHSIRLFVIRKPVELTQEAFEPGEVIVLINPHLSAPSEATWEASEGCLSIPGLRSSVTRVQEITVTYTSLDGHLQERRCSGWEARVVMHEYDHIEGLLFTDRLPPEEQKKIAPFLQNLEKRMHDGRAL